MLSFLCRRSPRTVTCHREIIYGENGRGSLAFYSADDARLMRATIPPHGYPKSIFEPPLHFHPEQTEAFTVVSGTMRVYKNSSGWAVLGAGDSATIPKRELHRFENASRKTPLVFDVQLDPALPSDEAFFRNAYSYAGDCREQHISPNIFQSALFLYEGKTIPGLPYLPRWLADSFMVSVLWLLGVFIGKWTLGFQGSYKEYYDPTFRN